MRSFGNPNVRLFQIINLSGYVFLTLIFLITWLSDRNINTFTLLGIEITFLGVANYFYLKLNEIRLNEYSVQLRNIFHTLEMDIAKFKSFRATFLSPFFFKIEIGSQFFYFIPDFEIILMGFFRKSVAIEKMNKEFIEG